jgi:aspartyl-tRNA(Asn)/glutamyl-tRNA(Gln) amidotransferase subunit C
VAVTIDDVRHVASLARLGLTDARAASLVQELNTILAHMDVLSRVDTSGVAEAVGVGSGGLPVRDDTMAPIPLARSLDAFAPAVRDGFLVVPRLATHEAAPDAPDADDAS